MDSGSETDGDGSPVGSEWSESAVTVESVERLVLRSSGSWVSRGDVVNFTCQSMSSSIEHISVFYEQKVFDTG